MTKEIHTLALLSTAETQAARLRLVDLLRDNPIPKDELLRNITLFALPQEVKRLLYMADIYQRAMPVHGVVMEFGCRWGANMALFHAFRSIMEPYNYGRKTIGFDTFGGFPSVSEKDGGDPIMKPGSFNVADGYESTLSEILSILEGESPIAHVVKHVLIKGDVVKTLPAYLEQHPETIIALAYFDMDLYEPTKRCLELIKPYITKGTIIAFDELNHPVTPGETVAAREVLGLQNVRIQRSPWSHYESFIEVQ